MNSESTESAFAGRATSDGPKRMKSVTIPRMNPRSRTPTIMTTSRRSFRKRAASGARIADLFVSMVSLRGRDPGGAGRAAIRGRSRPRRGSREWIQVDADHGLPHSDEGLRAVAVLQRDQDHVGAEDPVSVRESPSRLDPRYAGVRPEAEDLLGPGAFELPDDAPYAHLRSVEKVHLNPRGNHLCEPDDLATREGRDVPVDGDYGSLRRKEVGRRGPLGHEGWRTRHLSKEIVPSLTTAMGDESLGDYDPRFPCTHELLSADEGLVPRVGLRDFHSIDRIRSTNLPHPCQSGSAAGKPYCASHSRTVASTCSRVMFSWLMPSPKTFAPREKNSSQRISSSTVGMGHATTSRRKLRVLRAGACIITMPDGIEAVMIARVPQT